MGATPPHLFGVRVCRLMCVYVSGLFVYLCELYVKTQAVSEGGLFFFFSSCWICQTCCLPRLRGYLLQRLGSIQLIQVDFSLRYPSS